MKIRDLSFPIKTVKSNWVPATLSIDFTPKDETLNAKNACQSAVARQSRNSYVLEYIVNNLETPNLGFENDPEYLEEVERHKLVAGRLVAVHRIRHSSRPQSEIIGDHAYGRLQDMWSRGGKRYRWAVAFPIIESYDIVDTPDARGVFGQASYQRLFAHPSGLLRPLEETERLQLDELSLAQSLAKNIWIGIADEAAMAELSQTDPRTGRNIDADLRNAAMEGLTEEQKSLVRRRAAWLADRFILERRKSGNLKCDECNFDPQDRIAGTTVKARSLLDVHHVHPLEEGFRYTTTKDFQLLCPTCHRLTHAILREKNRSVSYT